jgi:hypothetical protein
MIIELPNFVPLETVNRIREILVHSLKASNHGFNPYRSGFTLPITDNPELKYLDDELQKIFSAVQTTVVAQRYRPNYASADSGYDFHRYPPDSICHIHNDGQFYEGLIRYASVILHLNTVDDGGDLVFPNQNKHVKTEAGKIVVFPPYGMFEHYTTPAKVDRDVIVCWFVYDGITYVEK